MSSARRGAFGRRTYCALVKSSSRWCSCAYRRLCKDILLSLDLHIRLVDVLAGRARSAPLPTESLLDLGCIPLNPVVGRRMVDRNAELAHHLLEITLAH